MFPEQPYEDYRLSPGRTLMVHLPAAGELRCLEGQARIVPAPQAFGDVLHTPQRSLHCGQAYRSEHAQWVRIEGTQGASRVLCSRPAEAAPQKQNRLVAAAARRLKEAWRVFTRAPSAAASRTR